MSYCFHEYSTVDITAEVTANFRYQTSIILIVLDNANVKGRIVNIVEVYNTKEQDGLLDGFYLKWPLSRHVVSASHVDFHFTYTAKFTIPNFICIKLFPSFNITDVRIVCTESIGDNVIEFNYLSFSGLYIAQFYEVYVSPSIEDVTKEDGERNLIAPITYSGVPNIQYIYRGNTSVTITTFEAVNDSESSSCLHVLLSHYMQSYIITENDYFPPTDGDNNGFNLPKWDLDINYIHILLISARTLDRYTEVK